MTDIPATPRIEDLIADAASNGWEFFQHPAEKQNPVDRVPQDRMQRLATYAAVLFDNVAEFRELMEFLADQTHRRAAWVAQLGLPMDQAYGYGVFREGQNAMMTVICNLIAEGRKQAATKPRDV